MQTHGDLHRYSDWVRIHDTLNNEERRAIRNVIRRTDAPPFFSLIVLSPNGVTLADPLIRSIRQQIYPYYELWLPDLPVDIDLGTGQNIRRIPTTIRSDVASMFNAALTEAEGDFILPLPVDARLAENALYELAAAIQEYPAAELLYTDEDQVDANGERCKPYFKTGWDPDLMLGRDAIGLLVAYRKRLLERLDGMRLENGSASLSVYELSLRAAFAVLPTHVQHIPAILCHRGTDAISLDEAEMARNIVYEWLTRLGEQTIVEPAPLAPLWNRVIRVLPDPAPLASVIVPTRDHPELLERCVESVLCRTDYPALQLIVVDNNSQAPAAIELLQRLSRDPRVRILAYPCPFNYAAINNLASQHADGEIIVLLNNDTKVIAPVWLREMVSHALRPDVGAVGAKLLYPDRRIQHAGIVLGPELWPSHQLRFSDHGDLGPFGELALTRTVSAVTGACLALRRAVFFEVGGLDEELPVAFNDIDLCLRLGDCGYRIVWTPFSELLHWEAVSRGRDDTPEREERAWKEIRHFWRRWRSLHHNDPFYNPNVVYGWDSVELSWPPRRGRGPGQMQLLMEPLRPARQASANPTDSFG